MAQTVHAEDTAAEQGQTPEKKSGTVTLEKKNDGTYVFGNEYLKRTFSLSADKVLSTKEITNYRTGTPTVFTPQAGSEEFIINTLDNNSEGEDSGFVAPKKKLETTGWKATADSVAENEAPNGGADKMFDGDNNTYYHSKYGDGVDAAVKEYPHNIYVDFGSQKSFQSLRYQQRVDQNGTPTVSGHVKGYKIYTLIEIGDGVIEVLATSGDNHLGGDDFDERIVNWLADRCRAEHGVDLTNDRVAMQRLREEAEKAKKELSSAKQTDINLPFLTMAADGALHLQTTLTRAKFEELCADLIERTALPVRNALSDARLSASDLDQVLLVGGSTRIPAVQAKVVRMTGLEPSKSLNPDECVALGAAVQAGRLGGEMLSGPGEDLLLMDVTPLTLSIETVGGVATHLIERNSTIPTRFSKVFTTAAPFQNTVQIKVLQGEREFARDNKLLGTFTLRGIKRAWAGVPKIEVTFDIDANGIVKVKARDMDTGKQQSITISGTSNLTEDEIKRAKENAAAFAGQDKERKAALEALNAGEAALYRVNTALGSKAGKALDRETRTKIKEAERTLERVLKHKKADKLTPVDVNAINTAREALSAVAAPLVARWESEKA